MTLSDTKTRIIALLFIIGLIACLAVAAFRYQIEQHTKHVELAMDYTDFLSLARSYGYNPEKLLLALHVSGVTSLALTEELGQNVGDSGLAYATTGSALLNQARLSPLSDSLLESRAKANAIDRDAMYLVVYDKATYERYLRNLELHFEKKTVRVLRASQPYIIEVHTQLDYFNNTGLGIPDDQLALAKRLHLLVIARFQNDERWQQPQFDAAIDNVLKSGVKVSDVVFFGLRNQVFGFPDQIPAAAAAFKDHDAAPYPINFGSIETYDASQVQKGNDMLGRLLPNQTVRVQAIAKLDQDKIKLDEAVGRYVLGVRERNVRVAYLRPWGHQDPGLSIEATNKKYIHAIAQELVDHGFKLTRAAAIPAYRGDNPVLVGLAALAVPSIFALLLIYFGWFRLPLVVSAYVLTELVFLGGHFSHHYDIFGRSVIALAGVVLFSIAAFLSLASAFTQEPADNMRDQLVRSIGATLVTVVISLGGALVVVGLMSSPVAMAEIEPMRGVKAVLLLPPLIALCVYLLSGKFGMGIKARDVFSSPVVLSQLLIGILVVGAGALLVMRSGNQSDLSPSDFELAARHFLGSVLSVRPRTKLFLAGIPFVMLAPALLATHRRVIGWVVALAIGVGIGDIIDTFSHLHTPLLVSAQRIFNGVVIGAIIGLLLIWIYRRACIAFGLLRVR